MLYKFGVLPLDHPHVSIAEPGDEPADNARANSAPWWHKFALGQSDRKFRQKHIEAEPEKIRQCELAHSALASPASLFRAQVASSESCKSSCTRRQRRRTANEIVYILTIMLRLAGGDAR